MNPNLNDSGYNMMDPSLQKQMAALVNTQAMIANHRPARPGTTSAFGGTDGHPPPANPPFFDPAMSARSGQSAALKQRQTNFLSYLASLMIKRNTPLPPALTGVAAPNYDPNTSMYKIIEVSPTEPGVFRLAGKDVDMFKLWSLVGQNSQALNANNAWHTLLPAFDLPEHSTEPGPNGSTSVASILQTYYAAIFGPFEEMYRKSLQEKSNMMRNAGNAPSSTSQSSPPSHRPFSQSRPDSNSQIVSEQNVLDPDSQSLKRKSELEEGDIKRVRQKTDPESLQTGEAPSTTDQSLTTLGSPSRMPTRRKIEYIPYAREVESYGGRDVRQLESELAVQRRQLRDVNEWGVIDIEAMTLSIRSRLSTELSYALTTLSLLSTMKGQSPGSGFPIFQCQDLLDEVLDLLEETAFLDAGEDRAPEAILCERLVTHRELLNVIQESESELFAGLKLHQGSKDPNLGPLQRPGNLVLALVNIIRNLSVVQDNADFLAKHGRLLDLLLRLCDVAQTMVPASPTLSPSDLITIRKDVLYILSATAHLLHFGDGSRQSLRIAIRTFRLIASYLVDPSDAVSPFQSIQPAGQQLHGSQLRPPLYADLALEACIRFSQTDHNRYTLSKIIPEPLIWDVFVALVHRLPVNDADFGLVSREQWLSYLEKNILCLYSLAFLAPPSLKSKLKADRKLGFKGVMLRMVQRFLITQDSRTTFMISAKRAIETMKILDDCENLFETPKAIGPTIAFGMGYGEIGENTSEKGTGLLGGHRELAWDMLMLREVWADDTMFAELESLARVDIRRDT